MSYRILHGDVCATLASLPDESVHCCVTSPPYWGLRDYGVAGQIGMEPTPEAFTAKMVDIFREVRRVLAQNGTLWLNLGDSYHNGDKGGYAKNRVTATDSMQVSNLGANFIGAPNRQPHPLLKPKDLVGIPWRVAFALQAAGWYLRSDIIWAKPNPMPESVTDRPTKAHEYLFLLSKSERYYYDAEAIAEPCLRGDAGSDYTTGKTAIHQEGRAGAARKTKVPGGWDLGEEGRTSAEYQEAFVSDTRNRRTVWTVATQPFSEAHFATFPPKLIEPCILAGCPVGGTVLDPFSGSGTTGMVALRHGRNYIGCELNPEYVEMSHRRIQDDAPLFNIAVESSVNRPESIGTLRQLVRKGGLEPP